MIGEYRLWALEFRVTMIRKPHYFYYIAIGW